MRSRISTLLVAAVFVAFGGLAITVPAGASSTLTRAPTASTSKHPHWKGASFRAWATGRVLGPSRYTQYGRVRLDRFQRDGHPGQQGIWNATTTVTNRSPASVSIRPGSRAVGYRDSTGFHLQGYLYPDGSYHPDSWWNPFSWDWSHILQKIWSEVKGCLSGAIAGVLPAVTGTTAVNLIFRGARLYVGPYGYAAVALGSCIWSVIHG